MPDFTPTRAEALRRLDAFVPRAGRDYAATRNADAGPDDRANVSNLSPYLRYRMITEAEVIRAVLARHSASAAAKFVQEVGWRTYWKGWLELRPDAWTRFLAERDAARLGPAALLRAVQQAEAGETGIEGFDDWARELTTYGYLHNHARMWFASIWVFTLRLPWTLGADFFLRHLIDADPASNTLSWRWVAGLQTSGKTYLATADNIARYTAGRFHPRGLATRAEALGEPRLPAPRALPPEPLLDLSQPALLLLHAEDLHPESLELEMAAIKGVLLLRSAADWPWGDKAGAFVAGALGDCVARAAEHFGCNARLIEPTAVAAAARDAGVRLVLTPTAPVGPVAEAVARLQAELAAEGVALQPLRRPWDERLWPHATKGYFAFKEWLSLDGAGDAAA